MVAAKPQSSLVPVLHSFANGDRHVGFVNKPPDVSEADKPGSDSRVEFGEQLIQLFGRVEFARLEDPQKDLTVALREQLPLLLQDIILAVLNSAVVNKPNGPVGRCERVVVFVDGWRPDAGRSASGVDDHQVKVDLGDAFPHVLLHELRRLAGFLVVKDLPVIDFGTPEPRRIFATGFAVGKKPSHQLVRDVLVFGASNYACYSTHRFRPLRKQSSMIADGALPSSSSRILRLVKQLSNGNFKEKRPLRSVFLQCCYITGAAELPAATGGGAGAAGAPVAGTSGGTGGD